MVLLGVEGLAVGLLGFFIAGTPSARGYLLWPASIGLAYCLLTTVRAVTRPVPRSRAAAPAMRGLCAMALCLLVTQAAFGPSPYRHGMVQLVLWFLISALVVAAARQAATAVAGRWLWPPPGTLAVLIGSMEVAVALDRHLSSSPGTRHRLAGFVTDRYPMDALPGAPPYLGDLDTWLAAVIATPVREVYVALPWSDGDRIAVLLDRLRFLPLTVRLPPAHLVPALASPSLAAFGGVAMPVLMEPPLSVLDRGCKRAVDLVLAALLLMAALPMFAVVAALIRLDSPGPVFFRQTRSGQFGVPFRIFKFRTLHTAQADQRAETLVSQGDRRVTRMGWFLRTYSIDEAPQVLNVLLGHMSLVGPRPHAPRAKADGRTYAEVVPDYPLRYRVKPGMTGWAQVNGWRGNTDTADKLRSRVAFDFAYIDNWSMGRDIAILLRTIPSVLSPPADGS